MYPFRILGLAMAMLAAQAHAGALTDPQFQVVAETVFRPVIKAFDIPGIAIGVTLDGQPFFFTAGLADRAASVPVDEDTLFELGSVSKLFNAALAGLGDARGLLSLDDPAAKHLPALAGSAFDRITLHDLAAHATGNLPLQVPEHIRDDAGLMAYLAGWQPGVDTRSWRSYSNVSIGLLGRIAGHRWGGGYGMAIEEHLLPGLGLGSTFVNVPKKAMGRYAFGHAGTDGRPVRVSPGMLDAEAYGIKSSVTDMTRFLDAHLGNLDLPDALAQALAATRKPAYDTAHFAQAMVWEVYPWPVEPSRLAAGNAADMALKPQPMRPHVPRALGEAVFLNKTGSTGGFGAYVALVPSQRIGVVVLANRNYPNPARADATLRLITELLAVTKR